MTPLDQTMRRVLALPREAGTPAGVTARDIVAEHLEALGYRVERQRFSFFPSSLDGFPVFGAGVGALALLVLPLLAVAAGALAGGGRLRGTSQGARDNGTGVAAALAAAERSNDAGTGILITGAEEFGLVGARVFVAQAGERLRDAVVVNLDTIDQ